MQFPTLLNFGLACTHDMAAGAVATLLGINRPNNVDQNQHTGGVEMGL